MLRISQQRDCLRLLLLIRPSMGPKPNHPLLPLLLMLMLLLVVWLHLVSLLLVLIVLCMHGW